MQRHSIRRVIVLLGLILSWFAQPLFALDLVKNGKPLAVIVVKPQAPATAPATGKVYKPKVDIPHGDRAAAETLCEWVKKISDAELPIVAPGDEATKNHACIFVGAAAVDAGLKLDNIQSPTSEGLRAIGERDRILIAGQDDYSTVRAVCRVLEKLGCRYFFDIGTLGEVFPRTPNVSLPEFQIAEAPKLRYRHVGGSGFPNNTLWGVWHGQGGRVVVTGHAWGRYISDRLFDTHPEYFAMIQGARYKSDWLCTSNFELRQVFAENVIKSIANGSHSQSIGPPDGGSYCECPACTAQDDPNSIEPSTNRVSVTNRYVDFFNDIARRVAKVYPDATLSFYVYADYTQAPTRGITLEKNLYPCIAPIRYCRFHRTGHPDCPSRAQMPELIDGWAKASAQFGYRTYNFNLAECTVPFLLVDTWKHDIPYLYHKGCGVVINETLGGWNIYGPALYLSMKLEYDPEADSDALLEDFYAKFYGPDAGPAMKEYWTTIDKAFVDLKCHTGSFYGVPLVYTQEFLSKTHGVLDKAAQVAKADASYAARVAIALDGWQNAMDLREIIDAQAKGDFASAKRVYDSLLTRADAAAVATTGSPYTAVYLKRFIGKHINAGVAATAPPRQVLAVLPDQWRFAVDGKRDGEAQGWQKPDFDDSKWKAVATYSSTLNAQGIDDEKTILWYRAHIDVPAAHGRLSLFVTEIDGLSAVFVNGKRRTVGDPPLKTEQSLFPRRAPFEVNISELVNVGSNTIAFAVDHSSITDLFLGGLIRPILLIDRGDQPLATTRPAPPAAKKKSTKSMFESAATQKGR